MHQCRCRFKSCHSYDSQDIDRYATTGRRFSRVSFSTLCCDAGNNTTTNYSEEEFDVDDNDEDSCACSGHHHDDDSEHTYHDNSHIELSTDEPNKHKRDVRNFNKSFTEKKIREIERSNTLLMNKILLNNVRKTRYPLVDTSPVIKSTSNTVNRKRRQQEIDRNNLLLLQRIQTVKPFGMSRRRNE
ncbi:Hemingway/CFA97 [Popillia japonica]|uniref:Hemingway/CFA97 n=1 Tax=Popillia japonica TaxID=7064 RepID=A0AAW1LWE8_POPJA